MRSRIKNSTKRATTSTAKPAAKKSRAESAKKGGFGAGSDRNDYYRIDQDSYDFSGSRMGMRSDRDSSFDYEAEDRSYRGAGRQPDSYYRDHDRGGSEERERDYSAGQRRNRQLDEDIYGSRARDEDYNDRNFIGTRNNGRSNYRETDMDNRGGGGDLYRDLDRDRTRDADYRDARLEREEPNGREERYDRGDRNDRYERENDRYQRSRDEYHDREEIRARDSSIGRDDFRSQDDEGYRNDHRAPDNLSGLSGGYGRGQGRGGNRNR